MTPTIKATRRDLGSVSLELVVLAPALLALVVVVVAAGRVALAGQAVQQAAAQAARDASLARSPWAGKSAGKDTAARVLTDQGLHCESVDVAVEASALALPIGRPGAVTVQVECRVRLADLGLPGLPGAKTLTSSSAMPTDPWTARQASGTRP